MANNFLRRLAGGGNWRQWAMRAMGWLHLALPLALAGCTFYRFLHGGDDLGGVYLRGLLVVIPVALLDLAAQRIPTLWQFLLAGLGICGLTWLLTGVPYPMLPVFLLAFFRGKNRLSETPVDSAMDRPCLPALLVPGAVFFYSALTQGEYLQRLCWLTALVYLLLWAAFRGLRKVEDYLVLNQGMAGLPARRILRVCGTSLLAMVLLAGALVPVGVLGTDFVSISLEHIQVKIHWQSQEPEHTIHGSGAIPLQELLGTGEGSAFQIPPIVGQIVFALLCVGLLLGLFWVILHLVRQFRSSFRDQGDLVQFLAPAEKGEALPRKKRRSPPVWDRSPSGRVRRRYRQRVLRAKKEPPEPWRSPAEIEAAAGLRDPQLHTLYEKARYSREGVTPDEAARALRTGK